MKSVRKKKIAIIAFLVLVEVTSVFLMYKASSDNKTILDDVMLNDNGILKEDMFAIMLEQEDGTYKESDDNTWPSSGYNYDSVRSGCIDANGNRLEGILSYDSANKIATVETGNTAFCYLYFSFPIPDIKVTNVDLPKLNTGKYIKSLDCGSTGTATFNTKYQRIEFGNITAPAECSMNYTEDTTTYPTLKSIVESKATEIDSAVLKVMYNASFTKLTESEYATITNTSTYPFVWNETNGQWIQSATVARSNSYFKYYPSETGGYQVCYTVPSSASTSSSTTYKNYIRIHLNSTSSVKTTVYSNNNSGETKTGCYDLGYLTSSDYYGQMIENVYWNTGANADGSPADASFTTETATQTVSGYIGLMSASDYGYAAASSYHSTQMSGYNTEEITGTNWLYGQGDEWTSIQCSGGNVFNVNNSGKTDTSRPSYEGKAVRPVLYLDSSVYVVSGEGTQASPYMIGM